MRIRFHLVLPMLAAMCSGITPSMAQEGPKCPAPAAMTFQIAKKISRDTRGFTQGFEIYNGKLFESTGELDGGTRLNTISLAGKVTQLKSFGDSFFGEGLTIFDGQIYQLSWQEHNVSVYDLKGKLVRRMNNPREGWGLAHDATQLIYSDGSAQLFYVDPKTFSVARTLTVQSGEEPVSQLNELEYVDGKIYANVFLTNKIVRINAATGCVEAQADLGELEDRMNISEKMHIVSNINFVLNGIAYDKAHQLFYLTGKSWQSIFSGRFVDK